MVRSSVGAVQTPECEDVTCFGICTARICLSDRSECAMSCMVTIVMTGISNAALSKARWRTSIGFEPVPAVDDDPRLGLPPARETETSLYPAGRRRMQSRSLKIRTSRHASRETPLGRWTCRLLRSRQQAIGFFLDHGIALATHLFQFGPVQHRDLPTRV